MTQELEHRIYEDRRRIGGLVEDVARLRSRLFRERNTLPAQVVSSLENRIRVGTHLIELYRESVRSMCSQVERCQSCQASLQDDGQRVREHRKSIVEHLWKLQEE